MIVGAVPVKDLANAKQRLIEVLAPDERAALARTMLGDVLRALTDAGLDAVWVVTHDDAVAAVAREFGADIHRETANCGHTAAVALAQRHAADAGAHVFVTVPGDVPLVSPQEIRALVTTAATAPAAVFTPSRSGRGTNGVALAPPALMPLRFGEPSFDNHLAAARHHGVMPRVLVLPGLGVDVDSADDLVILLADGAETESGQLLARWNVGARLAAPAASR